MTETGLGGGVDCGERRGYHLREADLYFEVVDPAGGAPVANGQLGEVVFTTLTREGMPLIRYRTGDLGRFLPDPCACGTRLKTLEHITTRLAGQVGLGAGNVVTMADLDEALFPLDGVLNFAAALDGQATPRRLTVVVQACESGARQMMAAVEQALWSIEAVRRACAAGHPGPARGKSHSRPTGARGDGEAGHPSCGRPGRLSSTTANELRNAQGRVGLARQC
jgi:phenylacetate-CoA ligase